MKPLTAKQQAFATNIVNGMSGKKAAIAAGYSLNGAEANAAALRKHPGVMAAIRALKRDGMTPIQRAIDTHSGARSAGRPRSDEEPRMLPQYASSLELLRHTYNNPKMTDAIRIDAAKTALPFEHARIAEKGKKDSAKDAAAKIANAGKAQKFATGKPPALKVHQGGKS